MDSSMYLSLGSNLGDRKANLEMALQQLQAEETVVQQQSSIYETEPVERVDQPHFLNLVCRIEGRLNPQALLELCHRIENRMGRVRQEPKGPRNIDIDILFYGRLILELPFLQIPHPALRQRLFVLIPLDEIAPEFSDPVTSKSIHQLRSECTDRSSVVIWDGI